MKRRVVVTGAGVISSLGDSPQSLHGDLREGRSGIRPIDLFGTNGLACRQGGQIPSFAAKAYLGDRGLGQLDRTSQLVASAARLALDASGWSAEMRAAQDVGLVLGTMFCSVRTIAEFDRRALTAGPEYASPIDFANTVINAAAGHSAIRHNLRGVNSTIACGATSGLQALAYAADLVRSGQAKALLAGGAEELSFESLCTFNRAGLLCGSNHRAGEYPIPFDARRNGFALAEGAALLMLEDAESAAERGACALAEVLGYGSGYDCSRGSDCASSVAAIARAVRMALAEAGVRPEEIACLSASANGSLCTDHHEAQAVAAALEGRARSLPVTAVKSMLGETLGAGGALQAAALLEAMRCNELPGIRALEQVDPGFPLEGVGAETRKLDLPNGLVASVGFDGSCCAMLLARREV